MQNRSPLGIVCLFAFSLTLIGQPKPDQLRQIGSTSELSGAIHRHLETLSEYLKDEKRFEDNLTKDKIKAKSGAIAVLAQALIAHPDLGNGDAQKSAAVREAAQKITDSETHKEATSALAELKSAFSGTAPKDAPELKESWSEVISMENMMEELNYLQGDLRRTVRRSREPELDSLDAKTSALLSLVLESNLDYAFDEEEEKEWAKYASDMKTQYLEMAEAMRNKDTDKARELHKTVADSCTACHDKFREE